MAQENNTLVYDGQFDWRKGMDSSLAPEISDPTSVRMGINVTFRKGRPQTRPGYQQIFLTDDPDYPGSLALFSTGRDSTNTKTGNYFQGAFFYVNKFDPTKSCLIACSGGYVFRIRPVEGYVARLPVSEYTVIDANGTFRWDATRRVFYCQAEKYLIIQNGVDRPLIFDGEVLYQVGVGASNTLGQISSIPIGTNMAYGQGRLFVVNPTKDSFTAGDLVYGGSTTQSSITSTANTSALAITGANATDIITAVGHTFTNNQGVTFPSLTGGTGLSTTTVYYVRDIVGDTFRVSTSVSGAAVNFTTDITAGSVLAIQGSNTTTITTTSAHGFVNGDIVTISGHSSTPNINGTWKVTVTGSTTFTIPANVTVGGTGGFAIKANSGSESDLLRFTETTYLNEGGSFQIPSQMGSIRGMIFQPISDTATGQGDLIVFGEKGACSFSVANPRDEWKNISGFQRVTLDNIGLVADRTLVTINNDLFFRSLDGLRTYRHARAQLDGYNMTPISTEMDAVMDFDTEGLLGESSAVYFDNRLLYTVSPRENYLNIQDEPIKLRPVSFQGVGVLDFNSMGTSGSKRAAVFDGVWTGVDVLQLVTGITRRLPRCFVFSYDVEANANLLWENYPWALFDFPLGASQRKIKCAVETRSYNFNSPFNVKKLERGDLWISELAGDTLVNTYWRPDENPCWFPWHSFNFCSEFETCIYPAAVSTATSQISTVQASGRTVEIASTWVISFAEEDLPSQFYVRLGNTRSTFKECTTALQTWSTTTADSFQNALNTALVGANPDGTNITCSVSRSGNIFTIVFSTRVESPVVIPASPECGVYQPLTLRDQYRSQLRLPTPPNECVTANNTLAKLAHSFQFRFEWEGQFALSKVMFVASRVVEQIGGKCP